MDNKARARNLIYIVFLATLLFACVVFAVLFNGSFQVAEAFETEYPTDNYLQISSPKYVSASADALAIYDDKQNAVFVKSQEGVFTYKLDNISGVYGIHLFGKTAFIKAAKSCFSIDISSGVSTPKPQVLSSPSDISYMVSDGKYLYAKSTGGYITVYDDNFNKIYDNLFNEALAGKFVVAPDGDTLHIFSFNYGTPVFVNLDLQTSTASSPTKILTVTDAVCGDTIVALSGGKIVALDKTSGETLFQTELAPKAFTAYGKNFFAVGDNNEVAQYSLNADNSALQLITTFCMSGSDSSHLNLPNDIAVNNDKTYIADTLNNRIVVLSSVSKSFLQVTSPQHIAVTDGAIHCASNDVISVITEYSGTQTFKFDQKIIDILYLDKLYVLTNNGIFYLFGGKFTKFCDITDGIALANAEDGNFIYVLKETCVTALNKDADVMPFTLNHDFSNAHDIKIDFAGNIFVLFENKIEKFANDITSLTLKSSYDLTSNNLITSAISMDITKDGKAYFTTEECFVGSLKLDYVSKLDFVYPPPTTIADNSKQEFLKPKTGKSPCVIPQNRRIDDFKLLKNNEILISFPTITAENNKVWALIGGELALLFIDDFEVATPTAINKKYIAVEDTSLYEYPSKQTNSVKVAKDSNVQILDNAANYDNGKWLRASYDNKVYFVKASTVKMYVEYIPEKEKVFGKAKADRVGGTVNIFSTMDEASTVLATIVDGAKVEVLATYDRFYLVLYGETVGYMASQDLQISGLTTVQIIAIVLSIVVVIAGAIVFVAVLLTKRKEENKE